MHLIDDQILHGDLQGFITLPVIILTDDLSAMDKRRILLFEFSPDAASGDRFRIGIQEHLVFVKTQSSGRVVDTVKTIAVFGCLDRYAEYHHCIDIADPELFRKGYFHKRLLFTMPV